MKCRVCSYEMPDDKSYCPICGTKAYTVAQQVKKDATEMAWNTKDFPRPKKLEDVTMSWGSDAFMSKDASEGYVTINKTPAKEPAFDWNTKTVPSRQQDRDFEIPDFMQCPTQKNAQCVQEAYSAPVRQTPQQAPTPAYTVQPEKPQPTPVYASQPEKPQPAPVYAPQPEKTVQKEEPRFGSWTMPTLQNAPSQPLWYTQNFTATGVMKTGPAYPLPQDRDSEPYKELPAIKPAPAYTQPIDPVPAYTQPDPVSVIQSALPDADIKYVTVEPPKPVYAEGGYPDYSDVSSREEKRPERFNTFRMKSAEFQKLLDQEYKRVYAIHGNDSQAQMTSRLSDTIMPESSVKAQSVDDFAKNLLGLSEEPVSPAQPAQPVPVTPVPAQPEQYASEETEFRFAHEADETDIDLEELISDPRNPKFDIDTLEMTIRNLKTVVEKDEEAHSARKAKLKAMEAAREAYFASLDAADGKLDGKIDATFLSFDKEDEKHLGKEISETIKRAPESGINRAPSAEAAESKEVEATAIPDAEEPSQAASASDATAIAGEVASAIPAEGSDEAQPKEAQNAASAAIEIDEDTKDLTEDFKHLYDDDEDDEDEPRNKHSFLKFLGILVLVIVVLELAILALKNFAPDLELTKFALQINTAVIESIEHIITMIGDWVTGLLAKVQ